MPDDAQKSEQARRPIPVRVALNYPMRPSAPRPVGSSGAAAEGPSASAPALPPDRVEDAVAEAVQQEPQGVPESSVDVGAPPQDLAAPEGSLADGALESRASASADDVSPASGNGGQAGEPAPARRRPTPVREALGQAAAAEAAASRPETLRPFEIDGQAWMARVAGRTAGGTGSSPAARLMAIDFFRADNPNQPVSRAVLQGRDLDALFDEEIVALFTRAAAIEKRTEQRKDPRRGTDRRRRRSVPPERGF